MQENLSPDAGTRQPQHHITPEIAEALRTLRTNDFRLESEYHLFGDWESRLEVAEELRALLDDLGDSQVDELAHVINDLEDESEDFSMWETRCHAAARIRRVMRDLKGNDETETEEVTVDVF